MFYVITVTGYFGILCNQNCLPSTFFLTERDTLSRLFCCKGCMGLPTTAFHTSVLREWRSDNRRNVSLSLLSQQIRNK